MSEKKHDLTHVVAVRDWKEYLGESLLIIFSVSLALILTEVFNKIHEKQQSKEILHQLREELIANKDAEQDQYRYHLKVMRNIDSALHHPEYARQFMDNGEVHLSVIVDSGVLRHDLNEVAWQIAKQNNVFTKLDLKTYSLLTDIYDNQQKIAIAEDEIGKLLLSIDSRKPENLNTVLILIRDTFYAWSVERAPRLLAAYQQAIDQLSNY
ncbi:MAG: hypothetical protein JST87_01880 [Bacteroidetes bacterium]|nr:hypothetical protein [Bacteroidota bacterium]